MTITPKQLANKLSHKNDDSNSAGAQSIRRLATRLFHHPKNKPWRLTPNQEETIRSQTFLQSQSDSNEN